MNAFRRSLSMKRRGGGAGLIAVAALLLVASGASAGPSPVAAATSAVAVHLVAGGFAQPVFLTNAGDSRLFVVERTGRIRILERVNGNWGITGTFLDLRAKVRAAGGEQGVLGLAFAPNYATTGRFYVDYINLAGTTVIAEYRRATAATADPSSARVVMTVHQPYPNHNGGWIGFKGPYLYIALGDGGSEGDPGHRGQDLTTLLGKILRINPLDPDGSGPKHFSIPADNPFVGKPGRDSIWAYGLRNPWRDSFDPLTGDLWIGDVGQDRYEEIDQAGTARGRNFGWRLLEGRHLYPSGALCTANCRTLPVVEYRHTVTGPDNCSVTGGYVSRRSGAPLYGRYVFGDYCSGRIWSIPTSFNGGSLPAPLMSGLAISSFGVGADGKLYVVDLGGSIYSITGS